MKRASAVLIAVILGSALQLAATAQPSAAGGAKPWTALLARLPDTPANRAQVVMNDYAAARAALGLPEPVGSPRARFKAFAGLVRDAGLAVDQLVRGRDPESGLPAELGFAASDVGRDAETGAPPGVVTLIEGDVDRDRIVRAAKADGTWSDALTIKQRGSIEYLSWDGEKPNVKKITAVRPLGMGGRLAIDAPFVWWSNRTAPLIASLDAAAGKRPSLADVDELNELDTAMTDEGAFAVFMSDTPVEGTPGAANATTLEPYRAFATGAARDGDTPVMLVALVHDDAATAHENAGRLRAILEQGTRADGAPWAELADSVDVSDEGPVVVARVRVHDPRLWYQVVLARDPLLAVG